MDYNKNRIIVKTLVSDMYRSHHEFNSIFDCKRKKKKENPFIKSTKNENDYEIEDFFILKYIRFAGVCISNEKEKNALKLFNVIKKSKYRLSILKQIILDE